MPSLHNMVEHGAKLQTHILENLDLISLCVYVIKIDKNKLLKKLRS